MARKNNPMSSNVDYNLSIKQLIIWKPPILNELP